MASLRVLASSCLLVIPEHEPFAGARHHPGRRNSGSRCRLQPAASEYRVKAAFVLHFTRFVEWPATAFADADSPLEICILGKDPFGRLIDDVVQGESVNGRHLVVRRITEPPPAQRCQVLFMDV